MILRKIVHPKYKQTAAPNKNGLDIKIYVVAFLRNALVRLVKGVCDTKFSQEFIESID